jgi:asparagine synthase (glutamine-hydrolysing)
MGALAGFVGNSPSSDPMKSARSLLDPLIPRRGSDFQAYALGNAWVAALRNRDTHIWSNDSMIVAVHGAIDNLEQLLAGKSGPRSADTSNPATVVASIARRQYPEEWAAQLKGAFTALVTDGTDIWVIRDHVGLRPVFMHRNEGGWYVATEAKQLHGVMQRIEPNMTYLQELLFGGDSGATVAFHGIDRVPRSSTTRLSPGEPPRSTRYWDPKRFVETSDVRDPSEAAEIIRGLIDQAVTRSVTGNDVLALSGGLDSTTIAAFAAESHLEASGGHRLKTLSAVYPDHPSVDESDLIEAVAKYKDLESHTFQLKARPLDDLSNWVGLLDGPGYTPSVPEIHEMYQVASNLGATTILTGELAEYVFSMRYQTLGHLVWNRRWRATRNLVAYDRSRGRRWLSFAREVGRSLAPSPILHARSRMQGTKTLPPWVSTSALPWFTDRGRIPSVGDRWPTIQLQPIMGDHAVSFDDVDIASSLPGIAVRHPLVDRDLWEFALSLRAEVKYPTLQPKALMRMAMDGLLPPEIVERRNKTYFDEAGLEKIDRKDLARWISTGAHRFDGVDYQVLRQRLESGDMNLNELDWAKNLARCHAFLARWE